MAIASNIWFITLSYEFGLTIAVSSGITLAAFWLVFWHWDRIRFLYINDAGTTNVAINQPSLNSKFESTIYNTGLISDLILFSVLRGLVAYLYCLRFFINFDTLFYFSHSIQYIKLKKFKLLLRINFCGMLTDFYLEISRGACSKMFKLTCLTPTIFIQRWNGQYNDFLHFIVQFSMNRKLSKYEKYLL